MYNGFINRFGEALDSSYHPAQRDDWIVVLGHGLTGNKDRPLLVALAEGLSHLGWPCIRASFAGNGSSQGRFEDSCITKNSSDLEDILKSIPEKTKIAYCGHSMGGAVGVQVASSGSRIKNLVSLAGMVRTQAFYSAQFASAHVGVDYLWDEPPYRLSRTLADDLINRKDMLSQIRELTAPLLLIHGSDDDIVPISDSELAFESAPFKKRFVPIQGAPHSFSEETYLTVVQEVEQWLRLHSGR